MNSGLIIKPIAFMGLFSFFSFFGCKNKKAVIENIDYPPFTIQKTTSGNKRFNPNYGRFVTYQSTRYNVLYKGQAVTFPVGLEKNTGLPYLWKAYILKDASQSAIIAGSQNMYLITEENKQLKLRLLCEQTSGFASLQWLDSIGGQPSSNLKVSISKDVESTNILEGGQYLLVNESAVLEVANLNYYPFNIYSSSLDDYHTLKVIGFSPDKREVVFVGCKILNATDYDYALLSFDYKNDQAYVVPFDQTDTRMQDIHDINQTWFNTFFKWQKTDGGLFKLKKKRFEQLPYWQGRFSKDGNYFNLHPAKKEMMQALSDFAKELLQLNDSDFIEKKEAKDDNIYLIYNDLTFAIGYFEKQKSVHFSKYLFDEDSKECKRIIEKVGIAFNKEMEKGKYQDYFTNY